MKYKFFKNINFSQIPFANLLLRIGVICGLLSSVIILATDFLVLIFNNQISPWHDEFWNLYPSTILLGWKSGIWTGCSQGMCINLFGKLIPLLSGPYHGALKTSLFSPFVIMGNVGLIRLMNLVLYLAPAFYIYSNRKYFKESGTLLLIISFYVLFPNNSILM